MKLALLINICPSRFTFNIGEEAYHKQNHNLSWRGPRTAIGQEGPAVFIRHGSYYIKAHSCRAKRANPKGHDNHTHKQVTPNSEISLRKIMLTNISVIVTVIDKMKMIA